MDPFAALKNTCPKISPWANTEGLKFGRGLIFRISYCGRSTQEGLYLGSVIGAYLRNRKHFPCFYRVIETRVLVWENEK
jgi:hypothetical protein